MVLLFRREHFMLMICLFYRCITAAQTVEYGGQLIAGHRGLPTGIAVLVTSDEPLF